MKKLAILALPMLFASCNLAGLVGNIQPYNIQMGPLGYEIDEAGKITIPSVTGQVVSSAGAPDIAKITFVGILIDGQGNPAVGNNNSIIAPFGGTLMAGVKGGYTCTTTPSNECTMSKADAQFAITDSRVWPQNAFARPLTPGEWAVAHANAVRNGQAGTAPWSADFTFTAEQANGNVVSWKQNYQFLAPAK